MNDKERETKKIMGMLFANFAASHELNGYEYKGAMMFANYFLEQSRQYQESPLEVIRAITHGIDTNHAPT